MPMEYENSDTDIGYRYFPVPEITNGVSSFTSARNFARFLREEGIHGFSIIPTFSNIPLKPIYIVAPSNFDPRQREIQYCWRLWKSSRPTRYGANLSQIPACMCEEHTKRGTAGKCNITMEIQISISLQSQIINKILKKQYDFTF